MFYEQKRIRKAIRKLMWRNRMFGYFFNNKLKYARLMYYKGYTITTTSDRVILYYNEKEKDQVML